MAEQDNTQTQPEIDSSAEHNKITQAMYDEAKRKERLYYGQATDYEKKLKELGDIEEVKQKLREYDQLKTKEVSNKNPEDIEALILERAEAAKKPLLSTLEEYENKLKETTDRLHKLEVVDKATSELNGFFPADVLPVVKDLYINKYIKKDSDGSLFVADEAGQPRHIGSKRMTLTDFANEILEKHPSFKGSQPSNNGRPPGASSNSANKDGFDPTTYQAITDKSEKIKYYREHVLGIKTQ